MLKTLERYQSCSYAIPFSSAEVDCKRCWLLFYSFRERMTEFLSEHTLLTVIPNATQSFC